MKTSKRPFSILCCYGRHGGKIETKRCTACHGPISEDITEKTRGFYMTYTNVFLPLCEKCRVKFPQ